MRNPINGCSSSFALVSVLALVSLAALTATAFLASARLERQATLSLSKTVQLEMALAAGEQCAAQVIGDGIQPSGGPNIVTTIWRGSGDNDWTNEDGYLFIGQPNSVSNLKWTYFAGFSPGTLTKLDTKSIESYIRWTNSQQGAYSNEISSFMRTATNGFSTDPTIASTSKICTLLPLLGGRTSPPVGWVYLYQDKRILGTTNATKVPVARFAWFMEDLSGKIDAERMGAIEDRATGTNPEEISLTNMVYSGTNTILKNLSKITNSNNRILFFTPGMLANSNISGLTNTNDVRYFATGLREWRPTNSTGTNGTPTWIPGGIYSYMDNGKPVGYKNVGYLKMDLNRLIQLKNPKAIRDFMITNVPEFTNRAGGMAGNDYLYALAANIIDYADDDSLPTSDTNGASSAIGWDSYPLPTQIFDKMVWNKTNNTFAVTTFLQLWNQSTKASPAVTYTLTNDFQETYADGESRMQPGAWVQNIAVPQLEPNQGTVLSISWPDMPLDASKLALNGAGNLPINGKPGGQLFFSNTISLSVNNITIAKINTPVERKAKSLSNKSADWSGSLPGLRYDTLSPKILTIGDPRMLNYISGTNPLSAVDYNGNSVWRSYGQTRNATTGFANRWNADPRNWPDGICTNTYAQTGDTPTSDSKDPSTGVFTPPGSALCKLSPTNVYTNITELGNIFDPIQWAPPAINQKQSDWVNSDIDTNWIANSMYGGGQTLRIGRPEHSRFAFTNLGTAPNSQPIPNMGQSAVALLDLFCIGNPSAVSSSANGIYRTGGKINLNTAPAPVLAALAGGIKLTNDVNNKVGSEVNTTMISAFANGVMRFRSVYPFLSPSQLAFISANYGSKGWTEGTNFVANAVFGTNTSGGLNGVTSLNDEGREEWFSKIYGLASVSSYNYRIYIAAQLVDTNQNPLGPIARKYCQYAGRPDTTVDKKTTKTINYGIDIYSWALTYGQKKVYESPY